MLKITKTKDEFPDLIKLLGKMPKQVGDKGEQWVKECVEDFDRTYREHLRTQGRGGQPPPLSPLTREIYSKVGEPDGSGIRNHICTDVERKKHSTTGMFGILDGKPTAVAKMQDHGAVVPVTMKMRNFLATIGIYLNPNTTHFVIPPRYSWRNTHRDVMQRSKRKLKQLY